MKENDFPYGIIATIPHPTEEGLVCILQFIGLKSEPTSEDMEYFDEFLRTDEENGMFYEGEDGKMVAIDFDLHVAPPSTVEEFRKERLKQLEEEEINE